MKIINFLIAIWALAFLLNACANKAQGPTGGPKDETPPKVVRSSPANGELNFRKKQIQVIFDENITLEKHMEQVMISPPQSRMPDIKANARLLTINFENDLLDSTTYTINFGNSVVDLNEKNPLKNFSFSFSTGNEIDTLQIAGKLINAEDLNPYSGILIGIYPAAWTDTVFASKPFLRVARTDENGRFTIENVRQGNYRIFALADANRDFFYQPGEGLAFTDSLFVPIVKIEEKRDTIFKDSIFVDTVMVSNVTRFLPDDILLRFFKENKKRQYLVKNERPLPHKFSLFFNDAMDTIAKIEPLNFEWDNKYLLQPSLKNDTLTFWLTDTLISKMDTLKMAVHYLKTDDKFTLQASTDTINVVERRQRGARAQNTAQQAAVKLNFRTNASNNFEIYNPFVLRFDEPIDSIDLEKINLTQKIDTTFKDLKFKWRKIDATAMNFAIDYKWEPEKSYRLQVDSMAFKSIYNKTNDFAKADFKIRSLDEYSMLIVKLESYDSLAVIQLLDNKDVVVATQKLTKAGAVFKYIKPGEYYLRLFIDKNENGRWDTGDWSQRTQPEEVFYYHKKINLRANWDLEETWDIYEKPLLEQKPADIKKDAATKK